MSIRKLLLQINGLILLSLALPSKGICDAWSGRFTLGGYRSTERFASSATGSDKNDFQVLSGRFFLRGERLGGTDWEFTSDLRDKHDFFDKTDAERLALTDRNEFQVRQFSSRFSNPHKFFGTQFGRFPVAEVGSSNVDGASIESHWRPSLHSTVFGGWNPQKRGLSYLQFDSKATIYGASLTYTDTVADWNKNFYASHGFVNEAYDNHTDRQFLFHNLIYQWRSESRFISMVYLDFVPRTYVQNANVTWQNLWTNRFLSELGYTSIDVIEYARKQEILLHLPSSPYQEGRLRLTYRTDSALNRFYLSLASGRRQVDSLRRDSAELGYVSSRIWGPRWDAYAVLGARKNFTADEQLARLGIGRYGRRWEFTWDFEGRLRKEDSGDSDSPLLTEVAISYYISRNSFLTGSLQYAADDEVTINSAFFKFSHRFGSREIPPLRDGAPPRGPL